MNTKEVDNVCSNACIRSGALIVILSSIILVYSYNFSKIEQLQAYATYIQHRASLQSGIELFESQPCWNIIKKQLGDGLNSLTIMEIEKECEKADKEFSKQIIKNDTGQINKTKSNGLPRNMPKNGVVKQEFPTAVPGVPTNEGITGSIFVSFKSLDEPLDVFAKINEDLLNKARMYSVGINQDIYRWRIEKYKFSVYGLNNKGDIIKQKVGDLSSSNTTDSSKKDLIREEGGYNSFRRLAFFESPRFHDVDKYIDDVKLVIPFLNIKSPLSGSILFPGLGMLILLSYMWGHSKMARTSEKFPNEYTLFGIINQSISSKIIFGILFLIPTITFVYSISQLETLGSLVVLLAVFILIGNIAIIKNSFVFKK